MPTVAEKTCLIVRLVWAGWRTCWNTSATG